MKDFFDTSESSKEKVKLYGQSMNADSDGNAERNTPIIQHKELYIRNRLLGFFFVEKIKQLTIYLLKK